MLLGKLIPSAMIAVGLFGGSSLGHAQTPELLIPLDGKEEARVFQSNEYFIKKRAYFARRYRIVRVDTTLLLEAKHPEINVSLFDGISVSITRDKLSTPNDGQTFVWSGHYTATPITFDEFAQRNPRVPVDAARSLYEDVFNVQMRGDQWVFDQDPANAESVAGMRVDREAGRIVYEAKRLSEKRARGTVVYIVTADLNLSAILYYSPTYKGPPLPSDPARSNIRIQIQPLPLDRRYSVVYKVDPDKMGIYGMDELPQSPAQREKVRQYHELLRSLGYHGAVAKQSRRRLCPEALPLLSRDRHASLR